MPSAHLGEIRGAKPIDNALHAARRFGIAPLLLEFRNPARSAQEGNQMAAGRSAPHAEVFRIETVLLRVRAEPANGGLAVLDLSGKDRVLAEPVVDAGHRVALLDEGNGRAAFLAAGVRRLRRGSRLPPARALAVERASRDRVGSARGRRQCTKDYDADASPREGVSGDAPLSELPANCLSTSLPAGSRHYRPPPGLRGPPG